MTSTQDNPIVVSRQEILDVGKKYKHINLQKMKELLPPWCSVPTEPAAQTLEAMFREYCKTKTIQYSQKLDFWVEIGKMGTIRIVFPSDDGVDHCGSLIINGSINPLGTEAQIIIPLNEIFSDCPPPYGQHSVYMHLLGTETALGYIGVTKNKWWSRFSQHIASTKSGSPFVFHRALREHTSKAMRCQLIITGVDYETAMQTEEKLVTRTLYPLGLNMIPGGHAGMKYLHKLGITATNFKQRDAEIERLAKLPSVQGMPNPLCAARWQSDQDFINRVICGHGDRLTVEQVRQIKTLGEFDILPETILSNVRAKNLLQVENVLRGKYYSKVN